MVHCRLNLAEYVSHTRGEGYNGSKFTCGVSRKERGLKDLKSRIGSPSRETGGELCSKDFSLRGGTHQDESEENLIKETQSNLSALNTGRKTWRGYS